MSAKQNPAAGRQALKALSFLLLLAAIGACLFAIAREGALGGGAALHYGLRVVLVALCLGLWFRTQAMIGGRQTGEGVIGDGLHELTAPLHGYLTARPRTANGVLIASSAGIDACGVFLLLWSVLGPDLRPFVALLIVFGLRQICQGICALPAPPGMIWRDPGFPTLFVTYDVGNDFFFSGHTALAMLCALELARISPWLGVAGGALALAEATVVIVLRAHYTLDVLAAIPATWCAVSLSDWLFTMT